MVYFIATPIGNLKDISFRALETLKEVDCIFCEDTRHSLKLLNVYEIKKPLYSLHKFNENTASEKLISMAKEGKNIAVISDAGTPIISDPGNTLATLMRENNVEYTIIPGACAFVSALVLSAFPADKFTFIGFLYGKKSEKLALLKEYENFTGTLIFYSAPQDVDSDISLLYQAFGERQACAVREITKIHESVEYFNLKDGLNGEKRGEYVLLVKGATKKENSLNSLSVPQHVAHYESQGVERKDALKLVAKDRGVSKSEIYKIMLDN